MPRVINSSYQELVEKAQEIFWLQGFKGVSNQELANHIGVSLSSIYNKYPKDQLFLDSLDYYCQSYSDPFLFQLRQTTEGVDSLRDFFYSLIDALIDKTFPKSCLMVNTVVELRNENQEVIDRYHKYFEALIESYKIVLTKAHEKGQFRDAQRIDEYAEFVLGIIFALSILYKVHDKPFLRTFIDEQLSFIQ